MADMSAMSTLPTVLSMKQTLLPQVTQKADAKKTVHMSKAISEIYSKVKEESLAGIK